MDWLAQDPVTRLLAGAGELVHPASAELSSESAHSPTRRTSTRCTPSRRSGGWTRSSCTNFSVFQDVVDEGDYDLVVGDEAWDVDHFWHENPELKRSAYAWVTDFVGWLPMPTRGEHEAELTADYNAEMIEHVERFRRIRDLALFIGDPDDVVPDAFGPGLPSIRAWTEEHYALHRLRHRFRARRRRERRALRRRLGYDDDRPFAVVTVGGSGVGETLLRRVVEAFPRARKEVDDLRDGGRRRAADRSRHAAAAATASRSAATSRTCSCTWRRATWPSSRAG